MISGFCIILPVVKTKGSYYTAQPLSSRLKITVDENRFFLVQTEQNVVATCGQIKVTTPPQD